MPCYDPSSDDRREELHKRCHQLTAMLCTVCRRMEQTNPEFLLVNDEIGKWWQDHKKHDAWIESLREKRRLNGQQSLLLSEVMDLLKADEGIGWTA